MTNMRSAALLGVSGAGLVMALERMGVMAVERTPSVAVPQKVVEPDIKFPDWREQKHVVEAKVAGKIAPGLSRQEVRANIRSIARAESTIAKTQDRVSKRLAKRRGKRNDLST